MKKIYIILQIPASKNPMLEMIVYVLSKSEQFDITIISPDNYMTELENTTTISNSRGISFILKIMYYIIRMVEKTCKCFRRNNKRVYSNFTFFYHFTDHLVVSIYHFFLLIFKKKGIILSIDAGGLTPGRWIKHFKNIPLIYSIYEVYPNQFHLSPFLYKYLKSSEKNGVKKTDLILSPINKVLGKLVVRRYKIKNKKIVAFSVCPKPHTNFSTTIIENPITLYYHGLLVDGRGLKELIIAMKYFDGRELKLFIRGFGDYKSELHKTIEEHSLSNRVQLLEPLPPTELSKAAANFDIGLTMVKLDVVNHRFACGFKTIDNINAGMVLMVPDGFVLKDLVTSNQIGFVYKDANVEALRECFSNILSKKAHIVSMKKKTRKLCSDYFNRNEQGKILIDELNALAI